MKSTRRLLQSTVVGTALLCTGALALPATIAPAAQGSWESGVYRNLFVEMGKTQAEVDTKVNAAFQQLFAGSASQRVFYEVGTDMGFIKTIDTDDIRSEGMSYGMMIAVQMDRQDIFDKLWKFSKTYMQHADGDRKGYFSWQLQTSEPYSMMDPNPAPDGEEYFVMALFFASNRWGDKTGIFAYRAEADAILHEMVRKSANSSIVPLMNPDHKMIEFSPDLGNDRYTDPSYHLPGFYTLWSKWAAQDQDFWKEVADTSRAYFKRACHPVTGLATEYQAFDGTPQVTSFNANSATFSGDSWRVAMNIAMDYAWFKADEWQVEQSVRMLKFFDGQGTYKSGYQQDGSAATVTYQSEGHIAMNAVAALSSNDPIAWKFVDALWKKGMATGTYRYYNGLLQMMALLHCSGNYKIWGSPALPSAIQSVRSPGMLYNTESTRLRVYNGALGIEAQGALRDTQGRRLR